MRASVVAMAVIAASGLAACGSVGASAPTSTLGATPAADTPLPTVAPTATPVASVGTTVPTTAGDAITVERTAPAQSGNQFETPPPGGAFLGAEIKECAGTGVLLVEPPAWSVKLADATQVDGTLVVDASPNPALQATNLNPGACTDGWVYFPLPAAAHPIEIHLLRANFYWTLQ